MGETHLTPEQSDWYQRRFGERFVAVQPTPFTVDANGKTVARASRRERRRNRFQPRRTP
jgi:hypothetical protein